MAIEWRAWCSWRGVVALSLLVFVGRVVLLAVGNPMELVPDEAHYWEWSRRLSLSYYTKGPGVAWVIALSTGLLGDAAWTVRLPTVVAGAMGMLVAGRMALEVMRDAGRRAWEAGAAALIAAGTYALLPGFQVVSLLMTIDGPYVASWMMALWLAYRVSRGGGAGVWMGLGAAIGVGVLFKYTMLLIVPGLLLAAWAQRPVRVRWGKLAAGVLVFLLVVSPILIWNAQRGWPTVAHQLGRVGLPGGDEAVSWRWEWKWGPEFWGAQLGLLGLFGAMLGFMAWQRLRRRAELAPAAGLLVWSSVPILGFYLLLSVFKECQGNWAMAGYASLPVLIGLAGARELAAHRRLDRRWRRLPRPRPRRGWFRRRPETPFQVTWDWFFGVGVGVMVFTVALPLVLRVPGLREWGPLDVARRRVSGHAYFAQLVEAHRQRILRETGAWPVIITHRYQEASELAFHLPDQPVTYVANHLLGGRKTMYDFFPDTRLDDPRLVGVNAILIGASPQQWQDVFQWASVQPLEMPAGAPPLVLFEARGYGGLVRDSP